MEVKTVRMTGKVVMKASEVCVIGEFVERVFEEFEVEGGEDRVLGGGVDIGTKEKVYK